MITVKRSTWERPNTVIKSAEKIILEIFEKDKLNQFIQITYSLKIVLFILRLKYYIL